MSTKLTSPSDNRLLGTPNDEVWPGVTTLPDYKPSFPNWTVKDLTDNVPGSNAQSVEMLAVRASFAAPPSHLLTHLHRQGMLVYDPAKRMSAKTALNCDYFRLAGDIKL